MKTYLQKFEISWHEKRLLYFAEGGGPESVGPEEAGEGGGGVSEEAAERAAEERRQAAATTKRQRKEEKKARKREHQLADIIQYFIHGSGQDDKMILLLSRLFQRNTSAAVLLAVLSLNHTEVIEDLENFLQNEKDVMPDDTPADDFEGDTTALVQYGKELSEALAGWTKRIFIHASFHPMKLIIAIAHHQGVDHNMVQLTALMVQRYFQGNNQDIDFERIKEFSELFWKDALKRLHQLADKRGLLPEPEQQDESDGDDEEEEDYAEE